MLRREGAPRAEDFGRALTVKIMRGTAAFVRATLSANTPVLLVCVLALMLRVASALFFQGELPQGGTLWNHDMALRIVETGRYLNLYDAPTAWNMPAYHFVLAAIYSVFGADHLYAGLLQAFVGAVCTILVYVLAKEYASHRSALLCSLMYATWPSLIVVYTPKLHNAGLYSLFVLLVLVLTIHALRKPSNRNLLALFVVLALSVYVHPELVLYPIILFAMFAFRGFPVARAASIAAVSVMVIMVALSPWIARNYLVFDRFIPLTTSGHYNFALGNAIHRGGNTPYVGGVYPPNADVTKSPDFYEIYWHKNGMQIAVNGIIDDPVEWLQSKRKTMYWLWNSDIPRHLSTNLIRRDIAHAIWPYLQGYWIVVLTMAVAGAVLIGYRAVRNARNGQAQSVEILLALLLIYWNLVFLTMFGEERYHIPLTPVVISLSVLGARDLLVAAKRQPARKCSAFE